MQDSSSREDTADSCLLVNSSFFLSLVIVREVTHTHGDFTGCLQDLHSLAVLDVLEIHVIYRQHLISFLQPSSVCI